MREKLFSVTAADCRFDYYRGSGKGGQHRNKTDSACRCTHTASGAVGQAEDERSQGQNKRLAFERMAKSKQFQDWLKIETMRRTGELALIREKVNRDLLKSRVDVRDESGRWVEAPELKPTSFEIERLDNDRPRPPAQAGR